MRRLLITAAVTLIVAAVIPHDARRPLINSAILAAGALVTALPIGSLLAVLLSRYELPGRGIALVMLGSLLLVPLYVQLSGWDAALGKLGWCTLASSRLEHPLLDGMRGAILIHGLAAIPWVALIVGLGLRQIDPAQEEAALLVAPPRVVLWRVSLRQATPFIIAAAIWTVVSTTSEMTVTNIYLVNPRDRTYTEELYMQLALSGEPVGAALVVLPGVAGLPLAVGTSLVMVMSLVPRAAISLHRGVTFSAGKWSPLLTAVLWLLVIALVGIPVASLIGKAGFVVQHRGEARVAAWSFAACLQEVVRVPDRFGREIVGTLVVAGSAATVALSVGTILGWKARSRGAWRWITVAAVVLALSVPGPLVGAALIQVFNHDIPPRLALSGEPAKSWLLILYDQTPLAPIIAQAIRALPLSTMLLWHSFATLDRDVLAAAALDGLSPLGIFRKIAWPQRRRVIIAAWLVALAVAAGDLAWAHLVTPPGLDLLQRRVFGLVHSGVEEQVAAICLVVLLVYGVLAFVVMRLLRNAGSAYHSRPL